MIHGDITTHDNVRGLMRKASVVFHLTGSRYFGNAKPNSDWDFFTDSSDQATDWLRTNGFFRIKTENYKDCQVRTVWRYGSWTGAEGEEPNFSGQIDVQLVSCAELKVQAQAYIFSNPWLCEKHNKSDKASRSALWDLVFAAMHGYKYDGALNEHHNGVVKRKNTVDLSVILGQF